MNGSGIAYPKALNVVSTFKDKEVVGCRQHGRLETGHSLEVIIIGPFYPQTRNAVERGKDHPKECQSWWERNRARMSIQCFSDIVCITACRRKETTINCAIMVKAPMSFWNVYHSNIL